jgi:hypothetical protein
MAQVRPHISGVSQSANSNAVHNANRTAELLALANQYIAEYGAPVVYRAGARRLVNDRMPASYDPQNSYGSYNKTNPHVCARWSDN